MAFNNAIIIIVLHMTIMFGVTATDIKQLHSVAYFSFREISSLPVASIINQTFIKASAVQCAHVCMEANSLYYQKTDGTCHCNHGLDPSSDNTGTSTIMYGQATFFFKKSNNGEETQRYTRPHQRDCLELYQRGIQENGVYTIHPMGGVDIVTWCDMTNGGWTVIQRRQDGTENFYRNWNDYVNGFGNRTGEYWLGLETIHLLTNEPSELYISLEAFDDSTQRTGYARYSDFAVSSAITKYKLLISELAEGNCGNSMAYHEGRAFSTKDEDNDGMTPNHCAEHYKGGWWYNACHRSNLNGEYRYEAENPIPTGQGLTWNAGWTLVYSLKKTVMKIRRRSNQ